MFQLLLSAVVERFTHNKEEQCWYTFRDKQLYWTSHLSLPHQAYRFSWKSSQPQEALLFERAEADSLNFLERQVFFKTRIVNYGEEDVLSPVHWCAKYSAWLFIVIYAVGLSFYVCLFAVKAGRATSVQWMISFWVAFVEVRWCLTHTHTLAWFPFFSRHCSSAACREPCAQMLTYSWCAWLCRRSFSPLVEVLLCLETSTAEGNCLALRYRRKVSPAHVLNWTYPTVRVPPPSS